MYFFSVVDIKLMPINHNKKLWWQIDECVRPTDDDVPVSQTTRKRSLYSRYR